MSEDKSVLGATASGNEAEHLADTQPAVQINVKEELRSEKASSKAEEQPASLRELKTHDLLPQPTKHGWLSRNRTDGPKWTDKAIVILTIGIVLLAGMQWWEMHDSGKQTDKIIAADERLAAANEKLATAMQDSVKQARDAQTATITQGQKSLNATIRSSRLDQRAWVGVGVKSGPLIKSRRLLLGGMRPQ